MHGFSVNNQAVDDCIILGLRDFEGTFWEDINDFPPACYAWIRHDPGFETARYWSLPTFRKSALQIDDKERATEEFRRAYISLKHMNCQEKDLGIDNLYKNRK